MAERLNNDFQFLDVARQDPEKKDINVRKAEFVEIYKPFTAEVAANQNHRFQDVYQKQQVLPHYVPKYLHNLNRLDLHQ
jgi:hypothetical protein